MGLERVGHQWVTKHTHAVLATTLITILNSSSNSVYSCLIPNLRGKAFSLSPLSMMWTVYLGDVVGSVLHHCN